MYGLTDEFWSNWSKKRRKSLFGFAMVGIVFGMDLSILFSTLYDYLRYGVKTENPEFWYGLTFASFFLTSTIFGAFAGRWLDTSRRVITYINFSLFLQAIGLLLYIIPDHPAFLLVGRTICGLADPYSSVISGEIARIYSEEDLGKIMTFLTAMYSFGFIIGPAMNFFFKDIDFNIGSLYIDNLNFVGIFMIALLIIAGVMANLLVHDCSKDFDLKSYLQTKNSCVSYNEIERNSTNILSVEQKSYEQQISIEVPAENSNIKLTDIKNENLNSDLTNQSNECGIEKIDDTYSNQPRMKDTEINMKSFVEETTKRIGKIDQTNVNHAFETAINDSTVRIENNAQYSNNQQNDQREKLNVNDKKIETNSTNDLSQGDEKCYEKQMSTEAPTEVSNIKLTDVKNENLDGEPNNQSDKCGIDKLDDNKCGSAKLDGTHSNQSSTKDVEIIMNGFIEKITIQNSKGDHANVNHAFETAEDYSTIYQEEESVPENLTPDETCSANRKKKELIDDENNAQDSKFQLNVQKENSAIKKLTPREIYLANRKKEKQIEEKEKLSAREILGTFLLNEDILLILLATFFLIYSFAVVGCGLPLFVTVILEFDLDIVSYIYIVTGVSDLLLLLIVAKLISSKRSVYIALIFSMISAIVMGVLMILFKTIKRHYTADLIMAITFGLLTTIGYTFDKVCLRVMFANIIPSEIQSFSEAVRSGLGRIALVLGMLTTTIILKDIIIWASVIIYICSILLVGFLLQRKSLINPTKITIIT